jgi:hypothetical protein
MDVYRSQIDSEYFSSTKIELEKNGERNSICRIFARDFSELAGRDQYSGDAKMALINAV